MKPPCNNVVIPAHAGIHLDFFGAALLGDNGFPLARE